MGRAGWRDGETSFLSERASFRTCDYCDYAETGL
jgi:hypothetical protein